ncbi:hypothetical protein [Streptomyces qinzhouensis]|nr:hypothetical protein [Streptomyces qinzhouensis]
MHTLIADGRASGRNPEHLVPRAPAAGVRPGATRAHRADTDAATVR